MSAVSAHLARRAVQLPGLVSSERLGAVAEVLAPADTLDDASLAALADFALAALMFDDLVDESAVPTPDVELRASQLVAVAAGLDCPECAFDPIARLLAGLAARLVDAPSEALILWDRHVAALFLGAVRSRTHGLPDDLDAHLRTAPSGGGAVVVALAVLSGATVDVDALSRAADVADRAVRLANDLGSTHESPSAVARFGEVTLAARLRFERARLGLALRGLGPIAGLVAGVIDALIQVSQRGDLAFCRSRLARAA